MGISQSYISRLEKRIMLRLRRRSRGRSAVKAPWLGLPKPLRVWYKFIDTKSFIDISKGSGHGKRDLQQHLSVCRRILPI